jgi:hypothetical protein
MAAKKFGAPESDGSAEDTTKRKSKSRKSPSATSGMRTIKERQKNDAAAAHPVSEAPSFDPLVASELIEACRAHVASLTELADVTARVLRECYEYEDDEPHLGQCCDLVRQILVQVQAALIPLGIVSHDTDPLTRAAEVAKSCEEQRRLLCPAVHVIRASLSILRGVEPNYHDEVLPALRDLESGMAMVIDGLERVVRRCP